MKELILASLSPRRKELLGRITNNFHVMDAGVDESYPAGMNAQEIVALLAHRKASAVASQNPEAIVIGCDTLVSHRGCVLGKPVDEENAHQMLRSLSGGWHEVYTGVCMMQGDKQWAFVQCARVRFGDITDKEISDYIKTGEPMDKAGAYGVQGKGSVFIERIDGSFECVMGLPLHRLWKLLFHEPSLLVGDEEEKAAHGAV